MRARQWQLGTLSDEVFESYISHMNATLGDAVSRNTFVNTTVIRYLPGFKAYVEDYIASNPLHE